MYILEPSIALEVMVDEYFFRVEPHNSTAFKIWVSFGEAFALPETLKLYNKLLGLGIKVVFITERPLDLKDVTASNLKDVGFSTWEKLIVRFVEHFFIRFIHCDEHYI